MGLIKLLIAILQVYSWLIVARVIQTWVNPHPRHELVLWIVRLTEPVLRILRAVLPLPGLDLSPILAWLLIQLLMKYLAQV